MEDNNNSFEPVGPNKVYPPPSKHGLFRPDSNRLRIATAAAARNALLSPNASAESRVKFANMKAVRKIARIGQAQFIKAIDTYIGDVDIVDKIKFISAIYLKSYIPLNMFYNSVQHYLANLTPTDDAIIRANPPELQTIMSVYRKILEEGRADEQTRRASEYRTRSGTSAAKRLGTNYNYETMNDGVVLESDLLDENNLHDIIEILQEIKRLNDQEKARLERHHSGRTSAHKNRRRNNNNTHRGPKGAKGGAVSKTRRRKL